MTARGGGLTMATMRTVALVLALLGLGCGERPMPGEDDPPVAAAPIFAACAGAPSVVDCAAGGAIAYLDGWACATCDNGAVDGCWTTNVRRCVTDCGVCQ